MNTPFDKLPLNQKSNKATQQNGYSIAAFTLGLLSLATLCSFHYSITFGGFSIACAILSQREGKLHGFAIVGITLAVIGIISSILITMAVYNFYTSPEFSEFFRIYEPYFNQFQPK